MRRLAAVDIGIVHMSLVVVECAEDYTWTQIDSMDLIDLTQDLHRRVSRCACALHHTKELADRMAHFFQEYSPLFDSVEVILVERQPLTGLQAVQLAFMSSPWRNKIQLLSPNQMHRHFGIHVLTYNQRKDATCQLLKDILQTTHQWSTYLPALQRMPRQHDVADAACFAYWWLQTQADRYRHAAETDAFRARVETAVAHGHSPFAEFMCRYGSGGAASPTPDDPTRISSRSRSAGDSGGGDGGEKGHCAATTTTPSSCRSATAAAAPAPSSPTPVLPRRKENKTLSSPYFQATPLIPTTGVVVGSSSSCAL